MAARSAMGTLIDHTKDLVLQTAAASPWADTEIQTSLDEHRARFEWLLMQHDPDYRFFYADSHAGYGITPKVLARGANAWPTPDFSDFYAVGFMDDDAVLRQGRLESSSAHTPDDKDFFKISFTFSTPPDVDLFIQGNAYNVWWAARDLLMRRPDVGRRNITNVSRGGVSYAYDPGGMIGEYARRGRYLNRRIATTHRA